MPESSSVAPSFLVAMPQLADPNFFRTVILLVENSAEGSFGLVLNRPAEIGAIEVCVSLDLACPGSSDFEVRVGGPVHQNSGWVLLHEPPTNRVEEVMEVSEGLGFTSSIEVLRTALTKSPKSLRLFLGYAGWASGQLEAELTQGAWILAPVSSDTIFDVPDDQMWQHVLRDMGINPSTLIIAPGVH